MIVDGIEVWRVRLDLPRKEIGELYSILNDAERERAGRFHREIDRCRFIAGRGTLRLLLGRYTSTLPESVRLGVRPGGKPALEGRGGCDELHFNISHCGDIALAAFADREVGIDLQRLEAMSDMCGIVANFFSADEVAAYAALRDAKRAAFFYRTWVRKEAYLKCTGEGFALDPSTVCIADDWREGIRLSCSDGTARIDRRFVVDDIADVEDHFAAMAVAAPGIREPVRVRDWPGGIARSQAVYVTDGVGFEPTVRY